MAVSAVPIHRTPPGIYRAARAFRVASAIVFVLIVLFAVSVGYSAYEVARSSIQSHGLSASFAPNGTVEIGGSFTLSNPGFYPIQGFELTARIANASGVFLGELATGPTTVPPSSNQSFPIALYLPVSQNGPATSLLTVDQYLNVDAWANATYAYLFPISVSLAETRSWGAPFEGLTVTVGAPTVGAGGVTVPVTVSFSNHASFPQDGAFDFVIESSGFATCGSGSIPVDVPPGGYFDQTQNVALSSGCSPAGGQVLSTYLMGTTPVPLPAEAIP